MRGTKRHLTFWGVTLLLLLSLPGVVWAQDDDEEEDEIQPPPVDKSVEGRGSVQEDLDLFWGGKRDEKAFDERLFPKENAMEFTLFAGVVPNDPFLTYAPVGARFGYHFFNSFGVELSGSFSGEALQFDSDLTAFLKSQQKIISNDEIIDRQMWRANVVAVWSPFYGKVAAFQRKLSHLDIYFIGGFGAVGLSTPVEDDATGAVTAESSTTFEGIFGVGTRVFLTDLVNVHVDYRQGIFPSTTDNGGAVAASEVSLGVAFLFGGKKPTLW